MKFNKLGNVEVTDYIKVEGVEYDSTQIKKALENALIPSLEYDPVTNYSTNTICSKDGHWYVSLSNNNIGNDVTDSTKWVNYLQNNNVFMEWANDLTYSQYVFVSYNGKLYKSLQSNNINNIPTIESEYWQEVLANSAVAGINLVGEYNRDKIYNKYDTVRYYGCLWTCRNDNTYRQDPPQDSKITETDYWYLYFIDGQSASLEVVETIDIVDYNEKGSVENIGNKYEAILKFTLPRGYDGKNAYEVWLQNGHTGTVDDFFLWLKDKSGTYSFTNDDVIEGIVTVPLTSSVVAIIDETGLQWQLPQGTVLKTDIDVKINILGIMAMRNIETISGTWYVALAGGVKGDPAISFSVGEINTVSFDTPAKITTTTDENGVVTFNMDVPRGRDALTFKIGTITVGNETNVTCETSDDGVVTLNFDLVEGVPGKNSYLYIAYASDDKGSNWSTIPNNVLKYRAEIKSEVEITELTPEHFSSAIWVKYIGDKGEKGNTGVGTWVYIAYAADSDGNDFSFDESEFRPYRAELRSDKEIVNIQENDFTGCKWMRYLGEKGETGGVTATISSTVPPNDKLKNGLIWILG